MPLNKRGAFAVVPLRQDQTLPEPSSVRKTVTLHSGQQHGSTTSRASRTYGVSMGCVEHRSSRILELQGVAA